jgi:hypothetical protein
MDSKQYQRLTAAFVTMAEQSNLPDLRTRWRRLAHACESIGKNLQSAEKRRRDKPSIVKRVTSRLAIAWATVHSSFEFLLEPVADFLSL